jgi:hypothetical protein
LCASGPGSIVRRSLKKTAIGFGSPLCEVHSTIICSDFFLCFYGGHAQGAFGRAGLLASRSTNLRMAATFRLVAKADGSFLR